MKWRISPLAALGLLALSGINLGLLVITTTGLVSDPLADAEKAVWKVSFTGSTGNVANRKPIETYSEIVTHPAFFKSRARYVPAPPPPLAVMVAAPPPAIVDPGLVLGGVMLKSDIRKAFLFSKAGTEGAWTAEGAEFMGWKVRSISSSGAKLEQTGRSIDLKLYPTQ